MMLTYTIKHRVRFIKYTALGFFAFGFDLLLLYTLTSLLGLPYALGVPAAFLIATSLHYAALRVTVFKDSEQGAAHGYAYFLAIMISNALAITLLVAGLVEYSVSTLYPARIAVGACFGLISFFLNSRYNFKIL